MANYRETDDECSTCGGKSGDRKHNKPDEPQGLSKCPHCNADKCCMCDMGDDVPCMSCENDE